MKDRKPWLVLSAALFTASTLGCGTGVSKEKVDGAVEKSKFIESTCLELGTQISHPVGWHLLELPPAYLDHNLVVNECLVAQNPVDPGEKPVGPSMSISRLESIPLGRAEQLAKQVAQTPRAEAFVVGSSYRETISGHIRVYESQFLTTESGILSHQWLLSTNIGGDVYLAAFTAPVTSAQAAYDKFGSQMLSGLRINGLPIKSSTTS